ncbi:hypothetical protein [Collibacillus ludicampi]|nr:hypothetical protein [Collibacillus ludicampi]
MKSYTLEFSFDVTGCEMEGHLNPEIVSQIHFKNAKLDYIEFMPTRNQTHVKGSVTVELNQLDDLFLGETFIHSHLIPMIRNTLAITNSSQDKLPFLPYFEPSINLITYRGLNHIDVQVLKEKKVKCGEHPQNPLKLDLNDFSKNLIHLVIKLDRATLQQKNHERISAIQRSFFWLIGAQQVGHTDGFLIYEVISKYRLLWTALNAIYNLYKKTTERQTIKNFARNPFIVDYVDSLVQKKDTIIFNLISSKLTLWDNFPISDELSKSIQSVDKVKTAQNFMFCLYAIRNPIIHGSELNDEIKLCKGAYIVLEHIVKKSIRAEIMKLSEKS